jgi:SAM-dependent methyltransferase
LRPSSPVTEDPTTVPSSSPRKDPDATPPEGDQGRAWSRHATQYDDLFLDPFRPGVESPLLPSLEALERPETLTIADLGCGTGPLLPHLVGRFGRVIAIDFAPGMLTRAKKRLGKDAAKVEFLNRPMSGLDDLAGALDVAVAVNSIVMPDVREIDRTLAAIRAALRPEGVFFAVLPAMDAIHYHTMLLHDHALGRGLEPEEAERHAAFHAEHHFYDFAFGRFGFLGLRQKFWQPFEATHRFAKAGFRDVSLGQVFYPWDESLAGYQDFTHLPRSWDWFVRARP